MHRLAPALHLVLLVALAAPASASAQAAPPAAAAAPKLTVTGEGHVSAVPDLAVLDSAVVSTAADATQALSQNSAATRSAIAAFRAAGIAERDIATSGFAVEPQYARQSDGDSAPPRIVGYTVRNQVTVKVRDLGKLGATLSAAVAGGANMVSGLSLTVADPERLLDQARRAAVADAQRRAALYADALGLGLGPLVTLSDGGASLPGPGPVYRARAMAASVPVAPGEQEIDATVTAVWRLVPK